MFGFLASPCRCGNGNLDSGEVETYRGFFCGLANRLHADYGPLGRFLVNRDATFLSLLTAAQAEGEPQADFTTCCNPLAKKRARFQAGDHASYAAAVTVCGLTAKIEDEIEDGSPMRRPVFRVLGGAARGWTRRAEQFLQERDFPVARVREALANQVSLEKRIVAGEIAPEAAAGPTRLAFGEIFGHSALVSSQGRNRDATRALGEELGEAIYWFDAVTDFDADRRHGRFNPLPPDERGKEAAAGRFGSIFRRLGDAFSGISLHRYETMSAMVLLRLTPDRVFAAMGSPAPAGMGAVASSEEREREKRKKRFQRSGERERWWDRCCDCGSCCDCDCCCSRIGGGKGGGCDACDCDVCDCCPCDCS